MIEIIVCAILATGIFFGGFFAGQNAKPTTTINQFENKTYVENKTDSRQTSMQGQVTIVGNGTNVNINFNDFTNIIVTRSTNSNIISITNKN